MISRNCREGDLDKCQMMQEPQQQRGVVDVNMPDQDKESGTGNHHFVYSISNDGGESSHGRVCNLVFHFNLKVLRSSYNLTHL